MLSKIVEQLGADPCILGMVVIVAICYMIIRRGFKHLEIMEEKRLGQWARINSAGKTDGSD